MFILKKGHQPGVYVPLRALFLVDDRLRIILSVPTNSVLWRNNYLFIIMKYPP